MQYEIAGSLCYIYHWHGMEEPTHSSIYLYDTEQNITACINMTPQWGRGGEGGLLMQFPYILSHFLIALTNNYKSNNGLIESITK